MKKLKYAFPIKYLFAAAILLLIVQSCVDKDYDWDKLNKEGVISIPPVMFGNIDTIYIEGLPDGMLPEYIPEGIPIPDFSISKSFIVSGLFDGNAVKNFFFDGAGTVEITAKADIELEMSGLTIDLYFIPINYDGERMTQVNIPYQSLTTGEGQSFSIVIASQYMSYMEDAKDLELVIVLTSEDGVLWLAQDDYILIKEAIIKSGGFHYEL